MITQELTPALIEMLNRLAVESETHLAKEFDVKVSKPLTEASARNGSLCSK